MGLPTNEMATKVMRYLCDHFPTSGLPFVDVADLRRGCNMSDDEYRDVFRIIFEVRICEPLGGERLRMNSVVQLYRPRFSHCTLNDVMQFARVQASLRARAMHLAIFAAARRPDLPSITLQALIMPGEQTLVGTQIEAVTPAWRAILRHFEYDPESIYQVDPRMWEETIAGAYQTHGLEVTLTPRSGDFGRDVIAVKKGRFTVRFLDQVKAYGPGKVVTANDVRAMNRLLLTDQGANKALVTTTSRFAPSIRTDPFIKPLIPYRLELRDRDDLLSWLRDLSLGAEPNPYAGGQSVAVRALVGSELLRSRTPPEAAGAIRSQNHATYMLVGQAGIGRYVPRHCRVSPRAFRARCRSTGNPQALSQRSRRAASASRTCGRHLPVDRRADAANGPR